MTIRIIRRDPQHADGVEREPGLDRHLEAGKRGFSTCLLEKRGPIETIHDFPFGKHVEPIAAEPAE